MEYNNKNFKRWSIIGERPTVGMAIFELAKENSNILAVVADVTGSAGLERMKNSLPEQVINVGIAEQNMMGIATGLSSEGYTVFTSSFAPFQSMRCLEQIRVNQGYMREKVIMVGLASGVAYGELGFTHCSIEDVSLMRSIPNIAVVSPADCSSVVKAVEKAIEYPDSVYIRLMDKTNIPMVYEEDYEFEIGKANLVCDGEDFAVLASGTMVNMAKKAAKLLQEENGINVAVYDFHTIKPIDENMLDIISQKYKAVLTVEEHSLIGGLGSAVSDYYADNGNIVVHKMGLPDMFGHGASHETLLNAYDLTDRGIVAKVEKILSQ